MSAPQLIVASTLLAALAYLATLAATAVVLALRVSEAGEAPVDDRHALSASRLTMPVSVVVPAAAGAAWADAAPTIAALLELQYPVFEVIVVADDLPPDAWEAFKSGWRLEAREIFFRASLRTAAIRMMYRSDRDPRLTVVHKMPAPAADALNCGVNLARFRYVCVVQPGVFFTPDALLHAMTAQARDPANVVAATSHVEIRGGTRQRLRSIRSLMASHLFWRHLRGALGPNDAVIVWRRDAVEQAGGFASDADDPHVDMMVRLQSGAAAGAGGRIARTAEIFGHRRPRPFLEDVRQTRRCRRATLQAFSRLRAAGIVGRPMLAYLFMANVLTSCAHAFAIAATAWSVAAGWLPRTDLVVVLLALAIGHGIVNTAAQLVRGAVAPASGARMGTAA